MKRVLIVLSICAMLPGAIGYSAGTAKRPRLSPGLSESLAREGLHAIHSAVRWLEQNQQENGCWSNATFPAMTGLAVSAILQSPAVETNAKRPEAVARGLKFIISCARESGGIHRDLAGVKGGGMPNYNTAVCLLALALAEDPAYANIIDRARLFLIKGQHLSRDPFRGGMGYDASTDRAYTDLSNTYFALNALFQTRAYRRADSPERLDREAAIDFISRCQHLKPLNNSAWVSEEPAQKGGFVYHPLESKAGVGTLADGATTCLLPYGSITYAALLSYFNLNVEFSDARVQAGIEWCERHWSLDENPGLGDQSLFYYYLAMARTLGRCGRETLNTPAGRVKWRPALIRKLISLQRITPQDGLGYWKNDNNRYWENDPNLATSYALLALEAAMFTNADDIK